VNDERHLDPDQLAGAATRAPDDPVRRHLDGCARCQARVLSFQRFEADPDDVPAEDRAEARARLHSALRAEMGLAPRAARTAQALRPGFFWTFLRPALAAVLVVAAGAWLLAGPTPWREHPDTMRDSGGRPALDVLPVVVEDGQMTVRWKPVAGADEYRVTFFTADLQPASSAATTREPLFRVPVAAFRDSSQTRDWLYVRVVALKAGEEIADSEPRSFASP